MSQEVSPAYELANQSPDKQVVYVLEIEGLDFVFSTSTVGQRVKYGDPGLEYGITYGGLPVVYGGIIPYGGLLNPEDSQKNYLNLDKSGMTWSQKVEPWDGKASVSTLNFVLTDINQEVLQLISPGVILDEILLKRCSFYIGFENIGFPEEFVRLYRGIISGISHEPGVITIETSDPNLLRRQKLFETAKTNLTSAISDSDGTLNVTSTDGFYFPVNAPGSASPEPGHSVGVKIGDEIITYSTTPGATSFTSVTRGALGTTATAHDNGAEITPVFHFEGNPLRIANKIMLSGWLGVASETGIGVLSIEETGDAAEPTILNSVTTNEDLKDKYGIDVGDFVTISGSGVGGNNQTEKQILSFFDVGGQKNRGIILDATLTLENPSTATLDFRSQYDVYPNECGLKMRMFDVDHARHKQIADEFVIDTVADMKFIATQEEDSGKTFIEKQLYVPIGAFSLTRNAKCSVVITAPPLPIYSILDLNSTNVLEADKAVTKRAVNSRKFYNVIELSYDKSTVNDNFETIEKYIDSDSLERIPYREIIQIESNGIRTERNAEALIDRTVRRIFERYAFGAQTISFKTTWEFGAIVEAGDIILINDDGDLLFPDLSTGQRGLPPQLWEVLEKSTDMKTGVTSLTIINGIGAQTTDRFGVISPSSVVLTSIDASSFRIEEDSFGALFPNQDYKKWDDYVGSTIVVHDPLYAQESESTFLGFDGADPYKVLLGSPLSFTPQPGDVMNLAFYRAGDPDRIPRLYHAFLSPLVLVASGASTTQFTVATGEGVKFWVGGLVRVHDVNDALTSGEVAVTNISGDTITVGDSLGFTPDNTYLVTFIGFTQDNTQTYRLYG